MSAHLDFERAINIMPEIPDEEFCVFGTVHAYPEHADALEAVYAALTEVAAQEPGTVFYTLARDDRDRSLFHMFERYKGRHAFEAHNANPIVKKLLEEDKYIREVRATFVKPITSSSG